MSSTEVHDSTDSHDPNIARMYKRDDAGAWTFREAWIDAGMPQENGGEAVAAESAAVFFVLNHGTVGHQSTSKDAPAASLEEARGMLAAFAEQCAEDGYSVLSREEQFTVVAQFALKSDRITDRDKTLAASAKAALTGHLAWRGSGLVEKVEFTKGPHSTGKLNVYILAPDPARAVANIKVCIREEKLDFTKLSVAVAPADQLSELRAKHSTSGSTAFSL
ncbi:hypothetical protein ACX80E_11725 [Arthrobacter sp. TMN-49]